MTIFTASNNNKTMKRFSMLFLTVLLCGGGAALFEACEDTKTYAELLETEKNAIDKFVKENNIKTILQEEFEKDTFTNVDKNEYVVFPNGLYLQIVDRGNGEKPKNRDEILIRFIEHDIFSGDTTQASNVLNPYYESLTLYPDAFYYTVTSSSSYGGKFVIGEGAGIGFNMYNTYGSTAVPTGWIIPLFYIKSGAHVKLIVPSKIGHSTAQQSVYPYFYDIRNILIN
jgi:FKBP-type peptidyl-prolyl cis-trans isomerase